MEGLLYKWLISDPVLTAIVEELFEALTTFSPECCTALVLHIAPQLAEAISTPTTDETVHLPAEAIQLANALVRSPDYRRHGCHTGEVVDTSCKADSQHGVIHLSFLVRKDCQKLVQW